MVRGVAVKLIFFLRALIGPNLKTIDYTPQILSTLPLLTNKNA